MNNEERSALERQLVNNELLFEAEDEDGHPQLYLVEFDYMPGDPGRMAGPPEDCCPPTEPEVEITDLQISVDGGWEQVLDTSPSDEFFEELEEAVYKRVEQVGMDRDPYDGI